MTPKLRLALASVLAVAALGAIAPMANAYIYWTNSGTSTIGRANNDGTNANQSFITGASTPTGVAVDGSYVYWTSTFSSDSIGRANLDGTGAIQSFIPGVSYPYGVAVDGNYIYWVNVGGIADKIGRANLNGTGANQSFITGANGPSGVAVDGNYIYWGNQGTNTIGRANLNGTGANQSFITVTGASLLGGVAVDGNYVYWTNGTGTIGRANLNGTNANPSFIIGASSPSGVAVDGSHIYWVNRGKNNKSGDPPGIADKIGRANLDGSGANQSFITGASEIAGLAVDSLPISPTISAVGKPTKTSLKVKVSCGDASACSLELTGKKVGTTAAITPKTVSVGAGQQPTVTLAYTRALKAALAKGGRVSVTATNPVTGGVKTIVVRVAK